MSDPFPNAKITKVNVIPDKETPLSGVDAIRNPAQKVCVALEISGPSDASSAGSGLTFGPKGPYVSAMTDFEVYSHE